MPNKKPNTESVEIKKYQKVVKTLTTITYLSFTLGVLAILISLTTAFLIIGGVAGAFQGLNLSQTHTVAPTTTVSGSTLAGIDAQLNASQLAVINNAPNSYFERAGTMYLNGSITNAVYTGANKVNKFMVNNKTSVIYLGSITCIFCAENRWAMALALSRFGNFSKLFQGYSSLGDGDVPTLYWTQLNYNISGDNIGNYYSSPYINFLSIEDTNPITGGFVLNTPSRIATNLAQLGNSTYISAFSHILNLSNNKTTAFAGTPYSIWGSAQFSGADAIDFGNTTPVGGTTQISLWTPQQILKQLSNPNGQFAWTEYAAADVYVAAICSSLSNSTKASVPACSLTAIKEIETQFK